MPSLPSPSHLGRSNSLLPLPSCNSSERLVLLAVVRHINSQQERDVICKRMEILVRRQEVEQQVHLVAKRIVANAIVFFRHEGPQHWPLIFAHFGVKSPYQAKLFHPLLLPLTNPLHFHSAPGKWGIGRHPINLFSEHRHGKPFVQKHFKGWHQRVTVQGIDNAKRLEGIDAI